MNYAYVRFSTEKQDEVQQMQAISEFAAQRGLEIDVFSKDEGVSGGVSYRDRNLYGMVEKMKQGDTLIVSEISRLGRSMSDLNKLINDELKPKKIRLIVIKMGLDMDCANLKAVDEMIFFALSFAAQIEKEMIQQRTQSAIDARKEILKREGGFFSKTGRWTTHLGGPKGADTRSASAAAGFSHSRRASNWRECSALYTMVSDEIAHGTSQKDILAKALKYYEKNPSVYCTREGKPLCKGTLSRWCKELRVI